MNWTTGAANHVAHTLRTNAINRDGWIVTPADSESKLHSASRTNRRTFSIALSTLLRGLVAR